MRFTVVLLERSKIDSGLLTDSKAKRFMWRRGSRPHWCALTTSRRLRVRTRGRKQRNASLIKTSIRRRLHLTSSTRERKPKRRGEVRFTYHSRPLKSSRNSERKWK